MYPKTGTDFRTYLDATRRAHGYLLLDHALDTNDRLRFRTHIFPSEFTVRYAPQWDETDKGELSPSTSAKISIVPTEKCIIENSDNDLVLGIAELALDVLNGNCKISRCRVDRLRKHKNFLERMVDKRIALSKNRNPIVQQGVFLLPLMTAALSALPSLINL